MMNPFSSRCCQHNHTQGWPYYAGHLWLATPDNGLAAALFNSCTVNALVADGREISVEETTNYPFDDAVHMRIHTPSEVDFPLYIRIPGWCRNGSLTINGRRVGTALKAGSYARISRTWKDGDELLVRFPMSIGIRRWAVNRNSISVDYGPLTFSLKIAERYEKRDSKSTAISDSHWQEGADESAWPSWEIYPDSPWNYALECDEEHPERSFTVVKKAWPEDNFPFAAESVPVEIRAKGSRVPSWTVDRFGLCGVLPPFPAQTAGDVEEITLIPMGAARLRISAFPELVK